LGACKHPSFRASQESKTQINDGKNGQLTQILNINHKVEEDLGNNHEGWLFKACEE
jgi:hypothetical protein